MIECRRVGDKMAVIVLVGYILAAVSLAYAGEASATFSVDFTKIIAVSFVILIGLVQSLLAYIYLRGQRLQDERHKLYENHIEKLYGKYDQLEREKLDKDDHKEICVSMRERRGSA